MTSRAPGPPSWTTGAAAAAVLALLAAGCSGSSEATNTGSESEAAPEAEISISPEDGEQEVRPDLPITVEAEGGALTDVQVEVDSGDSGDTAEEDSGAPELDEVTGTLSEDDTVWTSDWTLPPGSDITVTATAENEDGQPSEATGAFSTVSAVEGQRLEVASNFPDSGDEVGVGMPVILNFDLPVEHKAQVESAVEVLSEEPTEVAANWVGDQMMVMRPSEYWEPYQDVTVNVRLAGVQFADDMFADRNYRLDFTVGREQITEMHVPDMEMNVSVDGEEVKSFPVSNGDGNRPFTTTMSGTQLTMEKYEHLTMDAATLGIPEDSSEYYRVDVQYAVRISDSGEFTHAADYHASHGEANVSHGCTNMRTSDAQWFYDNSLMGDPLVKTGTDREAEWNNGWAFWQRSWEEWLENSELGEPQNTGEPGTPDASPVGADDDAEEGEEG